MNVPAQPRPHSLPRPLRQPCACPRGRPPPGWGRTPGSTAGREGQEGDWRASPARPASAAGQSPGRAAASGLTLLQREEDEWGRGSEGGREEVNGERRERKERKWRGCVGTIWKGFSSFKSVDHAVLNKRQRSLVWNSSDFLLLLLLILLLLCLWHKLHPVPNTPSMSHPPPHFFLRAFWIKTCRRPSWRGSVQMVRRNEKKNQKHLPLFLFLFNTFSVSNRPVPLYCTVKAGAPLCA